MWLGAQRYAAAVASITARRTAVRDILFAPKSHAAVAAIAAFYFDCCFVNKHEYTVRYS
jgi:hypothetical protein